MEEKQIYQKLCEINKEIGVIKKDQKNLQQGFQFRGIDAVMNELHSLFAKHEVIIIPIVKSITREERTNTKGTVLFSTLLTIDFQFLASDGSSVTATIIGEAFDSGDKGTNKAMSIALKYCLLQAFLIPTEDMADPDAQVHEVKTIDPETLAKKDIPTAENKPDADNRPWMTEKQKIKVIQRIEDGEAGVKENAFKTFRMKKVYREEIENAGGFAEQFEKPKLVDDIPF